MIALYPLPGLHIEHVVFCIGLITDDYIYKMICTSLKRQNNNVALLLIQSAGAEGSDQVRAQLAIIRLEGGRQLRTSVGVHLVVKSGEQVRCACVLESK